ncbi:MAG: hypothetical protein JXL97_12025 [Bacteroidales bacterium]|nr:hypothetical protein [Bacteroidales bacterium]
MKAIKLLLLLTFLFAGITNLKAQDDITKTKKLYVITKNDGAQYTGYIKSQDAREIYLESNSIGDVIIPKHEILKIEEIKSGEIDNKGNFMGKTIFSTRYFITTNGLPIEKGESYVQWNWYGPDFEFSIGKNFGIGLMTSWVGIPIIGTVKYAIPIKENISFGIGALVGTGSWVLPEYGGFLPYGVFTLGNYTSNINFSAGYGAVFFDGDTEGRALMSVAGISKVSNKISLVFDSFIAPSFSANKDAFALIIPGIRWQVENKSAFQFGFGGIYADNEFLPVPIPMVQWFRKIN